MFASIGGGGSLAAVARPVWSEVSGGSRALVGDGGREEETSELHSTWSLL